MKDDPTSSEESVTQFEGRKKEHIQYALNPYSQAIAKKTFDDIALIHNALPDVNFKEIRISDNDPKALFDSPFFVASMTAGHKDGEKINKRLAAACEKKSWAMAVGSQRRELFDREEKKRWQQIKEEHPKTQFLSNIGISQAIEAKVEDIQSLVNSLGAVALIIHTNPLQEAIQSEGTPNFKGAHKAIEKLCTRLTCPVILKETGCGFSKMTLKSLNSLGLFAVDLSGMGGTHWGRIEGMRSKEDSMQDLAAKTFSHWGISTLDSLLFASSLKLDYRIWASGGLRNGLDAAKAFALGAKKVSYAKAILEKAMRSSEETLLFMEQMEYELRIAMFCMGVSKLSNLQQKANIMNYQSLLKDLHV